MGSIITKTNDYQSISRRQALRMATIPLLGAAGCILDSGKDSEKPTSSVLKIGLLSDVHHAHHTPYNNRYYSHSYEKLGLCIDMFNALKPDFIIQLGDIYNDTHYPSRDIAAAEEILALFRQFDGETYNVLGNHDVAVISRNEYLDILGMPSGIYSFDKKGFHCIVLDGNYKLWGSYHETYDYNPGYIETYILPFQQKWLRQDLADNADKPTIIFLHQCLDLPVTEIRAVKNAPEVRQILEEAGTVKYVFQGHEHNGNYSYINGIHYVTLRGMVEGPGIENNSFGFGDIGVNTGSLDGFVMQPDYALGSLMDE